MRHRTSSTCSGTLSSHRLSGPVQPRPKDQALQPSLRHPCPIYFPFRTARHLSQGRAWSFMNSSMSSSTKSGGARRHSLESISKRRWTWHALRATGACTATSSLNGPHRPRRGVFLRRFLATLMAQGRLQPEKTSPSRGAAIRASFGARRSPFEQKERVWDLSLSAFDFTLRGTFLCITGISVYFFTDDLLCDVRKISRQDCAKFFELGP